MKLYKQRTEADCLLTCLETLLQTPREELPEMEWYGDNGSFLSYASFADGLIASGAGVGVVSNNSHENLVLDQTTLLGFKSRDATSHCCIWTKENRFYDPYFGGYIDPEAFDPYLKQVRYAVVFRPSQNTMDNIDVLYSWDLRCKLNRDRLIPESFSYLRKKSDTDYLMSEKFLKISYV